MNLFVYECVCEREEREGGRRETKRKHSSNQKAKKAKAKKRKYIIGVLLVKRWQVLSEISIISFGGEQYSRELN